MTPSETLDSFWSKVNTYILPHKVGRDCRSCRSDANKRSRNKKKGVSLE